MLIKEETRGDVTNSLSNEPCESLLSNAAYEGNRLLAGLPACEAALWRPQLEHVRMSPGQVLHESGAPPLYVYFPGNALVSLQYVTREGASAEIAMVGCEGVVGIAAVLGGGSVPIRAVVRRVGSGLRMTAHALACALERSGPVRHQLLRYAQALMTQTAQRAVCNQLHSLDQRLCGWLLESTDRGHDDELVVTQQVVASALGVRRETVTAATRRLQESGKIRCGRGHIALLDRKGLQTMACECYAVVSTEHSRLLPPTATLAGRMRPGEHAERAKAQGRREVRAGEASAEPCS